MSFLSKPKREILKRRIKSFWMDFSHNRIGFVGLIIILGFVVVGIIAPLLTPFQPTSQLFKAPQLAAAYSMPDWFRIFPQYSDLNPTLSIKLDLKKAEVANYTGPISIDMDRLNFSFAATEDAKQTASVTLDLGNFSYEYSAPPTFTMHVNYRMYYNRTGVKVYFTVKNYTANPLWDDVLLDPTNAEMLIYVYKPASGPVANVTLTNSTSKLNIDSFVNFPRQPVMSSLYKPELLLGENGSAPIDPARILFSQKGVYGIKLKIEFDNIRSGPPDRTYLGAFGDLNLQTVGLTIWGRVHGIMGTDAGRNDAWTELVYGVRISLMVGVLAAIIATSLGILYGVTSGYLGGFADEFLMRVVDVLLCIPVLPILLILTRYFFANVYLVVVLIAIFGWQGLSRVIRSRVLTLKEMSFIESARASGASDSYLMVRHLIPNVLPVAMAAMVLAVPGAIITEAALSFLGFGDPNAPTWGRMLYGAYQLGGLPAWWVWLPPGLAITVICIGFVFIGHAIDEIVNPRLRRRR
ncbi:MAG: ABC transporter permease [Candidatus Bathyarchaeota archaeon]|nr:ABC transporter permease [Candidatus Bathyarchaeota archaeon]MDH5788817.1 ABC transporter permease [Candidatus Bathyarchaeota archaeon]